MVGVTLSNILKVEACLLHLLNLLNLFKEEIAPLVTQLLALKTKYAELNNGVPYDPPKTDDKKKDKKPPTPPVQETKREGKLE